MKRSVAGLLCLCLMAGALAGCGRSDFRSTRRRDRSEGRSSRRRDRDHDEDDDDDETRPTLETVIVPTETVSTDVTVPVDPTDRNTEPTETEPPQTTADEESDIIRVWAFSEDVRNILNYYTMTHPGFSEQYELEFTIIPTSDGAYEAAVEQALFSLPQGDPDVVDLFFVESDIVPEFTAGEMRDYVYPYTELGIDIDSAIEDAQIAPYAVQVGTDRTGQILALPYESNAGAVIYRRSIARDVFGTDDPEYIAEVLGSGSGNWDSFEAAAQTMADHGYHMVSSYQDLWNVIRYEEGTQGWIVNGFLNVDDNRDGFFDLAHTYVTNGWSADHGSWYPEWFLGFDGSADIQPFCYMGPSWLLNYTIDSSCGSYDINGNLTGTFDDGVGTYGDWAVCPSPVGFFWGGTWVFANARTDNPEAVADLIYWMTLDCSETGLQYNYAGGLVIDDIQAAVPSNVVMSMVVAESGLAGGQNIFDAYAQANLDAQAYGVGYHDAAIDHEFLSAVSSYIYGQTSIDQAHDDFYEAASAYVD